MQGEFAELASCRSRFGSSSPRIAVVGVGALGSEFCRLLGECGLEQVLLIDPDDLQGRNLSTSLLYRQALEELGNGIIGRAKTQVLQRWAERRFGLQWTSLSCEIADVGLQQLDEYDILCCCGDSALCRAETALAARTLELPMLDGGVFGEGIEAGRATWFAAASDAACYLCGLAEARRADLLSYAASASLGCAAASAPSMTGAPSAVGHTARVMMRLLDRWASHSFKDSKITFALRLRYEGRTGDAAWGEERLSLPRGATCPWHEGRPRLLIDLPWQTPLSVAFAARPAGCILQCMWPVCLSAQCRVCRFISQPLRRVAWVRRHGVCPQCGSRGGLEPLQCLDSVHHGDAAASKTPRQLGMPDRHLYEVRRAWQTAGRSEARA